MLMATGFESDFSGLIGFSYCGCYLRWCAQQYKKCCLLSINILFRRCDNCSDEI